MRTVCPGGDARESVWRVRPSLLALFVNGRPSKAEASLNALQALARGSMVSDFAKRLDCSGWPALSDRTELRPMANGHKCVCEVTAILPQSKRKQASTLQALREIWWRFCSFGVVEIVLAQPRGCGRYARLISKQLMLDWPALRTSRLLREIIPTTLPGCFTGSCEFLWLAIEWPP